MKGTRVPCGQMVAVYVEDDAGRRVVLAVERKPHGYSAGVLESLGALATNKREMDGAIAALRSLRDELPDPGV